MGLPSAVADPLQFANHGLPSFNDPAFVGEIVFRVFARKEVEVYFTQGIL